MHRPPPALTAALPVAVDVEPLAALLEEQGGSHLALARRMLGDPEDAHEAVQEAWIRAWSRRGSVRDPGALGAWVRAIVARECLRRLRWRAARQWLSLAAWLPDSVDPALAADDALDRARAVASLRAVVDRLPPRQRLVWGLRFDEGWSVAEIAAATGIGPETVKTHLKRALQKVGAP